MNRKILLIVLLIPIIALFGCSANEDITYNKKVSSSTEQENIVEQRNANSDGFYVYDNEKRVLQQWTWDKGTTIAEYENLEMVIDRSLQE